jgi:hypothetical protein
MSPLFSESWMEAAFSSETSVGINRLHCVIPHNIC